MKQNILTPKIFTIGGRNYYLSSIFGLIDREESFNFFEFLIFNDIDVRKILLWKDGEDKENSFLWILFIGEEPNLCNAKFLISNKEDDDIFSFLDFVNNKTPQALPYILFNYVI